MLIPSVLTILVPMACRLSFELALFTRMAIGFFESATFPCVFHFFPIWIPQDEKNKLIPLTVSGMYIGNIIGFSCSGYLVNSSIIVNGYQLGNWPAVFYFFGLLGVFWFPFWIALAYERPQDHPGISQEELYIFEKGITETSF